MSISKKSKIQYSNFGTEPQFRSNLLLGDPPSRGLLWLPYAGVRDIALLDTALWYPVCVCVSLIYLSCAFVRAIAPLGVCARYIPPERVCAIWLPCAYVSDIILFWKT